MNEMFPWIYAHIHRENKTGACAEQSDYDRDLLKICLTGKICDLNVEIDKFATRGVILPCFLHDEGFC